MSPATPRTRRSEITAAIMAVVIAAALSVGMPHARAEAPIVVATIAPVHSLVAAVMAGVGTPHLLIPANVSPHDFSLAPSDARSLANADIVFWAGDDLEDVVARSLDVLNPGALSIRFEDDPRIKTLPSRDAEGTDPHLWLDPANGQAIVTVVVEALARLDPDNAAIYETNGAATIERIARLAGDLEARLTARPTAPFAVFHDAYQYLEKAYDLKIVGAVAISPEDSPSARRLSDLRRRVVEFGAVCVFSEPQYSPRLVNLVLDGSTAQARVIDPLGAGLDPGPDLYFEMMLRLGRAIAECLTESG